MIELFEKNSKVNSRQSSKGNQLKWQGDDAFWYKADYTGYEGLAEYFVSNLLKYSTLDAAEALYGRHLQFHCGKMDVKKILEQEMYYPKEVKERIFYVVVHQMAKYQYLFR